MTDIPGLRAHTTERGHRGERGGDYGLSLAAKIAKYVWIQDDGCWIWTGRLNEGGYGKVCVGRRDALAHRAVYEFCGRAVPSDRFLLHQCDRPSCVRPSHLYIGTQTDNMQDMVRRRRSHSQRKTHCPQGHPLVAGNLRPARARRGCRSCRTCALEGERRRRQRG